MSFRIAPLAALIALLGLAACNTVEGAGQDIRYAGDEISETANEVQNDL
ncbi:entericidin A/B family lipoprotein [Halovulum sp. GXIMD14794]